MTMVLGLRKRAIVAGSVLAVAVACARRPDVARPATSGATRAVSVSGNVRPERCAKRTILTGRRRRSRRAGEDVRKPHTWTRTIAVGISRG